MDITKTKKFLALFAIICGGIFTIFGLLSIWGVISPESAFFSKVGPTFAILTAASLALLAIAKMMENKN